MVLLGGRTVKVRLVAGRMELSMALENGLGFAGSN
jgi:hypothetical protein